MKLLQAASISFNPIYLVENKSSAIDTEKMGVSIRAQGLICVALSLEMLRRGRKSINS